MNKYLINFRLLVQQRCSLVQPPNTKILRVFYFQTQDLDSPPNVSEKDHGGELPPGMTKPTVLSKLAKSKEDLRSKLSRKLLK